VKEGWDEMKLITGDCLEVMRGLEDNSVDSVVTDPPYGLSFMGKKWDYDVPSQEIWEECLRVLKPGGYLLSFAGTRTQHRMAVRIEDAGFEIRDMIAWVYGSGFPKSLNIGKAVDKLQGNEREVVGKDKSGSVRNSMAGDFTGGEYDLTKGTSDWEGWGTALKPALEPITVARKPLGEKTVAENVLKWGVGGINIDGSRVGTEEKLGRPQASGSEENPFSKGLKSNGFNDYSDKVGGRFPANLIHDGSDDVVSLFPNDSARFFYCPKASKSERNRGCEGMEDVKQGTKTNRERNFSDDFREFGDGESSGHKNLQPQKNFHPTVKPIALMEYLVKLVTPPKGTVLDPFMGSGTTGIACKKHNYNFIGIELDPEYMKIAKARIKSTQRMLL